MQNAKQTKEHAYTLGHEFILLKSRYDLRIPQILTLNTDNGPVELEMELVADFNKIPEKYHEVFLNMITSKYLSSVSFGLNPFSQCNPPAKRRWWRFWKSK